MILQLAFDITNPVVDVIDPESELKRDQKGFETFCIRVKKRKRKANLFFKIYTLEPLKGF